MARPRLTVIHLHSGRECPPFAGTPVVSSAATPWPGITLEQHRLAEVELLDVAPVNHFVVIQLQQVVTVEWKSNGEPMRRIQWEQGQVMIQPHMVPHSLRASDAGEIVVVAIEPQFLLCAAHELARPDDLVLVAACGVDDSFLHSAVLALRVEAEAGAPGGRLYGETLAAAMSVHLVRRHSRPAAATASAGSGLSRHQLRRSIEYMHEHLAQDISLTEMAAAAGLSPYHFARLFKKSMGVAPHHYLVTRRVERARELLLLDNASLADVALQVGFCDQSHLAAHFKAVYGLTPSAFVRQMRPAGAARRAEPETV